MYMKLTFSIKGQSRDQPLVSYHKTQYCVHLPLKPHLGWCHLIMLAIGAIKCCLLLRAQALWCIYISMTVSEHFTEDLHKTDHS